MRRILIVCGGNTCRSPMAQALAARIVGYDSVIESAGMDADAGSPASAKAIAAMKRLGFDLTAHRSREIEDLDLTVFDLIIAMRPSIAAELIADFKVDKKKLKTLDIEDPVRGGTTEDYRKCAAELQAALPAMLD
jgi:protein-tyrosine phosphatase